MGRSISAAQRSEEEGRAHEALGDHSRVGDGTEQGAWGSESDMARWSMSAASMADRSQCPAKVASDNSLGSQAACKMAGS